VERHSAIAKGHGFGNPYMTKDMARMILKLIILHRIREGEVYSYALIKEFDNPRISGLLKKRSGVKNDIYNTIKVLDSSGYIRMKTRIEKGRLKKYYYITERGGNALKESKKLFLKSMQELMSILG
jgi:DNA-binding PadR family transcriptional regulator